MCDRRIKKFKRLWLNKKQDFEKKIFNYLLDNTYYAAIAALIVCVAQNILPNKCAGEYESI